MRGKFFKFRRLAGMAVVLATGVALLFLLAPPKDDRPPIPSPNAYDYFVRAGRMFEYDIHSVTKSDEMVFYRPIQANPSNRLALAEFRRGLQFECVVPQVSWVTDGEEAYHAAMNDWSDVRGLLFLLKAEEAVAREQGRARYASQCAIELIELGYKLERGGSILNVTWGLLGIETGGKRLSESCRDLDSGTIAGFCDRLLTLDSTRESLEIQERRFRRRVWEEAEGLQGMEDRFNQLLNPRDGRGMRLILQSGRTRIRLLIIELALEAFHKSQGDYPGGLAELVPGILRRLPEDPFGNSGFVYRRSSTGYSLYSLGPNGADNGETPISASDVHKRKPDGDVLTLR